MGTNDIPLDQYNLTRKIGVGGMGEVYLAEDTTTGTPVAIKVIKPGAWLNRFVFEREIAALRALRHPSIVRVLDSGIDDGTPWYAMELVGGRTLAECLRQLAPSTHGMADSGMLTGEVTGVLTGSLPASSGPEASFGFNEPPTPAARTRMLGWLVDVARALAYIHGEDIVHGDLKPANVMITRADRAVLIDFGLAGVVGSRADPGAFATAGLRMGTAGFLAPERIRGEGLDARADLYALGCLIYLAITGRGPAGDGTAEQQLRAHIASTPPAPSVIAHGVPPELDALVAALLHKDPASRPAHAGLVATKLQALGAVGSVDPALVPDPKPYLYRPGFIGRGPLLESLFADWASTRKGRGGVTVVHGPAGAGKTRAVAEFIRTVRTPESLVYTAHADAAPLGSNTGSPAAPLVIWDRVLRQLGSTTSCKTLLEGSAGQAEASARLAKVLSERLEVHANSEPVLIALDDLQWADALSRRVLHELAVLLEHSRVRIVAASQNAEEAPGVHNLAIDGLTDDALDQILDGSLGSGNLPSAARRVVLEHAGGSPFLAIEWLRILVRRGVLARDESGDWTLGAQAKTARVLAVVARDTPDHLIRLRLSDLDEPGREMAGLAAVLGHEFDGDDLAIVWRALQGRDFSKTLGQLLHANLLTGHQDSAVRWQSEELRRATYDVFALEDRQRLHDAVASQLRSRLSAPDIAHHLAAAGHRAEARSHYLRAAKDSTDNWALDHAASCYEAGLRLGARDDVWLDASVEYLRDIILPRDYPETVRRTTEVLRVARNRSRTDAVGHCHSLLAECALMAGDLAGAQREDTIALRYHARALDTAAEVRCLLRLARVQQLCGRLDDAEGLAREAAGLAVDLPVERGQVLATLASILSNAGRLNDAIQHYRKALQTLRRAGSRRHECVVRQNLGAAHATQGNPEAALESYAEALAIAIEIGDLRQEALIRCNIGVAHANLGHYGDALEHNRRAQAIYRSIGQAAGLANTQRVNGQVLVEMGRPAEALDELHEVFAFFWETGQPAWCGDVLAYIGWAHIMMGDAREALSLLDKVDQLIENAEFAVVRSMSLRLRVRALMAVQRNAQARAVLVEAEEVARQMGAIDALEEVQELWEALREQPERLPA